MIGTLESFTGTATAWIADVHQSITDFFAAFEPDVAFVEELWQRPGGGGGVTRVLSEGTIFEKVGVNRSAVEGRLEPGMVARLALPSQPPERSRFFATGVSVVAHPRSPMVPTVHLNVRYFEITTAQGEAFDAWFGGGTDLTPTYPYEEDAAHFHRTLAAVCDQTDVRFYSRYKAWCDDYFRNRHRNDEARGVGGIFFDHLRPDGPEGRDRGSLHAFADAVARVLPEAYGPLVEHRHATPYGERERRFQLYRRGRYAEFNLLHDRGTSFGLQSGARTESVLMSMPPLASWEYAPAYLEDVESFEARLIRMLCPRNWLSGGVSVS